MEIKEVKELVYIPEWSTHAYICANGEIYVQLQLGRCFTRKECIEFVEQMGWNEEALRNRLRIYDELEAYYKITKGG